MRNSSGSVSYSQDRLALRAHREHVGRSPSHCIYQTKAAGRRLASRACAPVARARCEKYGWGRTLVLLALQAWQAALTLLVVRDCLRFMIGDDSCQPRVSSRVWNTRLRQQRSRKADHYRRARAEGTSKVRSSMMQSCRPNHPHERPSHLGSTTASRRTDAAPWMSPVVLAYSCWSCRKGFCRGKRHKNDMLEDSLSLLSIQSLAQECHSTLFLTMPLSGAR